MNSPKTPITDLMHAVLDGEASDAEARQLESRLAADPAARAEFDEWKRLFQALQDMPREYAPEGLVAAVTAALPAQPTRSAAAGQLLPGRRVLGHTTTRTPGSRLGDSRAMQPPTPTRSVPMSEQSSRFFASRKGWLGAGIAAAAVVVVAQLGFDFPVAKDVMGTVAPAQRYRAAPNGSEDVKLAPAATPGAAIVTAPDPSRAVAERADAQKTVDRIDAQKTVDRVDAQKTMDRIDAQKTVDRVDAQKTMDRVDAQKTVDRVDAQKTMDRVDAQKLAERTKAERMAERSLAEKTAQRIEADRLAAQRAMEKTTNRTAQP